MPRIIVTTDPVASRLDGDSPILLDERVHTVHLSTGHAAAQLVERLAWAISDAEDVETAQPRQLRSATRAGTPRRTASRGRARVTLRA